MRIISDIRPQSDWCEELEFMNPEDKTDILFIDEEMRMAEGTLPLLPGMKCAEVYELLVRTMLVQEAERRPNELNRASSALARAKAQSDAMEAIEPCLTKEEDDIYRRGRNAKSHTMAKNATVLSRSYASELHMNGRTINHMGRKEAKNDPDYIPDARIEGRNSVIEAYRSGRTIDKLFVQEGLHDGPVNTVLREAKKAGTIINYVTKERLNEMSETGHHQGVIAQAAAFEYAEVEDILKKAEEAGEPPFIIVLDGIQDPHNLGAIIRTACLAGAHGVIIQKRRAAGLTPVAVRASAGAVNYVPVARVVNIGATIDKLKEKGIWFVCADMGGKVMYDLDLKGPIGLVVGSEGEGAGRGSGCSDV